MLKLKSSNNEFAIKEIKKYYLNPSNSKYKNHIEYIFTNFENGITDFDKLKTNNKNENIISKKLIKIFKEKLNQELNNNSGIFGVKKSYFLGAKFYYKDLIRKEFVKSPPIYKDDLLDLEDAVRASLGVWLIIDENKMAKLNYHSLASKKKRRKKAKKKKNKEFDSKSIDKSIRKRSRNKEFQDMKVMEKEKEDKFKDLEKKLGLNQSNDRYKTDRHEFFR